MKRTKALLCCLAAASALGAQTTLDNIYLSADYGAHNSAITAIDLDNDGLCDLVFAGIGTATTNHGGSESYEKNRMAHVMMRLADGTWAVKGFSSVGTADEGLALNVADRPSLSVCDINADGLMDIVAFETTGHSYKDLPYIDNISREGIFIGQGDGTFRKVEPTVVDGDGNATDFDMRHVLSGAVADVDNDGLLDIITIGYQINGRTARNYPCFNCVLLNQGGGRFVRTNFFSDDYAKEYGQNGREYHFECGFVEAYDFNCDGYTDFLVSANSNDRTAMGTTNGSSTHFLDIFLNDPAKPGQFRRMMLHDSSAHSTAIAPMSEGGVAIADFNGDGVPDLFLSGWTGNGRSSYEWGIYAGQIDDDGNLSYESMGDGGLSEMRCQNSVAGQYGAFDWNGDGIYDIVNMGWSTTLSTQTSLIAIGDGTDCFSEQYRAAAGSEGAMTFADWDGDGAADLVAIGQSADQSCMSSLTDMANIMAVSANPCAAPERPHAPVLAIPQLNSDATVTLSWSVSDAASQNSTFEYFVKDSGGNLMAGGNALTGGSNDGVRKVMQPGNAFNSRKVTLRLPDGDYTYGVQTVSPSLIGSTFATGTFTVSGSTATPHEPIALPERHISGKTYANPVIDASVPDPTWFRDDDGTFYLYGTENTRNVPIYKSDDMVNWDYVGTAFTEATRPTMVPDGGIWAPDIHKRGNKYMLYFSKSEWGGTWDCGIGVARSTQPDGNFRAWNKIFLSSDIDVENSIDPFVYEEDGNLHLFWGSFHGIYAIQLASDGLSVAKDAEKTKIAGGLTEATTIVKHDGRYYLIGSAGSCCEGINSTYRLVVARADSLYGPYLDKFGNNALDDSFSNLLYRTDQTIGPGHCSEWITDDAGQYWMVYHGYEASDPDGGRKVYLDKIQWDDDGWPYIENMQPSTRAEVPRINTGSGISQTGATDNGEAGVSVSPTRCSRSFTISQAQGGRFSYKLTNMNGQTLRRGQAKGQAEVSVGDVPTGLYVVTVKTLYGMKSEKILRR